MAQDDTQTIAIPGPGNFQFSGVKIDDLGATEYTLASMVVDISGSVSPFKDQLLDCVKSVVAACQKHPYSNNLLFRLLTFNSSLYEVHGFLNLADIDPDKYDPFYPSGMTALFDAYYDGVGATVEYGKLLVSRDFRVNGIVIGVTDGMNNQGTMTPNEIKKKWQGALAKEEIESLITILIGLHEPTLNWAPEVQRALSEFQTQAELSQFIDIGDATPENLAKLGNFVSESISSQSNALVTGAPSASLSF
jgi:hypothetical protein